MSTYRCSQCGSRISVAEGTKIGTCPACQAIFVLPNQFAQKENLYLLAADARHSGDRLRRCTGAGLPRDVERIYSGINEIIEEKQRQLDEYLASKE